MACNPLRQRGCAAAGPGSCGQPPTHLWLRAVGLVVHVLQCRHHVFRDAAMGLRAHDHQAGSILAHVYANSAARGC